MGENVQEKIIGEGACAAIYGRDVWKGMNSNIL